MVHQYVPVAESVYAPVSKADAERRVGSSPTGNTKTFLWGWRRDAIGVANKLLRVCIMWERRATHNTRK